MDSLRRSPESQSLGFIYLRSRIRSDRIIGEVGSTTHRFLCRREGVERSVEVVGFPTLVARDCVPDGGEAGPERKDSTSSALAYQVNSLGSFLPFVVLYLVVDCCIQSDRRFLDAAH